MSTIIGALIFIISHAITVTVLRKQESAPGNATINGIFGIHTSSRKLDSVRTVFRLPSLQVGQFFIPAQIVRRTGMNIQSNRGMENQGSSQLLQLKVFFSSGVIRELVHLYIHEVFSKDREEIHKIIFSSSTDEGDIHKDVALAAGIAITAVHVDQERNAITTIQLAKVCRCGKTEFHGCGIGAESKTFTRLLVDVLQFTDPKTLLVLVGSRECRSQEHGYVHRLIFGQGEPNLQVTLHITKTARFATVIIYRVAELVNSRKVKVVVIDRNRDTHVKIMPDTEGKTHIGTQCGELGNFTPP